MAATDSLTLAKINYCCREGLYRQLQTVCMESVQKYGNDPVLVFWKAYGILMEEQILEAVQEFESVKEKRDVVLCATMALIVAYKRTKSASKEAIQQLEQKLKSERTSCGETALYFAGMFLFHSGRPDKAREYIDRMLKMSSQSKEGLIMRGWIDLKSSKEQYVKKAVKFFDEVLSNPQSLKEVDAMLGKIECFKMKNNFSGALEIANQLVVLNADFYPGLVEKMRLQLALQDWDQSIETAQRLLASDGFNIEALKMQAFQLVCRESKYPEAVDKISEIIQALDRIEPKAPYLYYNVSRGLARVSGRNPKLLQQTLTLMERARSISSSKSEFMEEVGYQNLLLGKSKEAMKCYRLAMKMDETSVPALTGIIHCQILEGSLEDAEQQLEFLNEIHQSIGKSAEIIYLTALLGVKRGKSAEEIMQLVQEAMEAHFGSLAGLPLGSKYFEAMNPDFLVQLAHLLLQYAPTEPSGTGQLMSPILKRCTTLLEPVVKTVPGLLEGLYLMARVKYVTGDVNGAKSTLHMCLEQDPTYVNAHLLMAQIHLYLGDYNACDQSLENGLSYNFEVRNSPLYHIIKARTQRKLGNLEECLKTLQTAMAIPGVKRQPSAGSTKDGKNKDISLGDRVAIYLELAEAQRLLNHQHEAAKTMQDAINEFQGTPEEIRITIANANFSLMREDVEHAVTLLRQITPEQSYYLQAREKLAEIYLNYRKDKRLYASVYRELVEKSPTPQTYILLGDAYMSIQEPEKAIEVFESALKKNPRDGSLASKIGQALIKTHQYTKAISYYEAALKTGNQSFLRYDLAELHLKLKNYDKAERVLKQALQHDETVSDLSSMIEETKCLLLLSRVYQKNPDSPDIMAYLSRARELQSRVLKRAGVEQPDALPAQKALAASINSRMGEHYASLRDYEKAIKSYKEALFYNEGDSESMLALSRLYLTSGDLDSCQHYLSVLLKNDSKDKDHATVMMADLMFLKGDYEAATFHFQQLLERKPDHYDALAKLVTLLRRAGKLSDCGKFIEEAQKANLRSSVDPGFNYCRAMYEWYQNDATSALKHFNLARKDTTWGEKALYNMIQICLNPDSDIVGGETFEAMDAEGGSMSEKQDSEQMALRTADKLLREVKPKSYPLKHKILANYVLMASKSKGMVEKALSSFMEIAATERDCVPALLGMATSYMVLKQTPKARNQLKRVAKMPWNAEDADDFEKSWLLLSDIYIQNGKFDLSLDLLKRCLQYNKSCAKAWEYMGFIMEKEQAYKDAAFNYQHAWKNSNESNPAIGYRLAFNYLKARRFVDAIDICHQVLGQHPNYPKIRKEILDKARNGLRT